MPFVHSIHFHVPQCSLISHVRSDGLRSQCVCVCFNGGASIHFVPMLWDQVTVSDWIEDIHRKYAKHILSADSRIYTFVRVSVCVNHARAAFLVSVRINFVVQTQKHTHSRRRDEQKKNKQKSKALCANLCSECVIPYTQFTWYLCVCVQQSIRYTTVIIHYVISIYCVCVCLLYLRSGSGRSMSICQSDIKIEKWSGKNRWCRLVFSSSIDYSDQRIIRDVCVWGKHSER